MMNKTVFVSSPADSSAHGSNEVYGVCSNWIASHHEGCLVNAFVRRSEGFHLPSDASLPVVMVGAGVSIAPFR